VVVRALALCEGDAILLEHLPDELQGDATELPRPDARRPAAPPSQAHHPPDDNDNPEKRQMIEALEKCLWNQSKAATLIGMPRRTFLTKMARYGIPRHRDVLSDPQAD
jgi:transcriptional regulator of acetoin/glycerol metabolism